MTIKMTRDPEIYPAPHEADVHADEVETFAVGGWVAAAQPEPKPRAKKGLNHADS